MNNWYFQEHLVREHQQKLLYEAEERRRVKLATAGRVPGQFPRFSAALLLEWFQCHLSSLRQPC